MCTVSIMWGVALIRVYGRVCAWQMDSSGALWLPSRFSAAFLCTLPLLLLHEKGRHLEDLQISRPVRGHVPHCKSDKILC